MSQGKDPARLRVVRDLFFWIGVAMVVAALTVVALSNAPAVSRLERETVPLSWILAAAAIGALFVAERCNTAASSEAPFRPAQAEPGVSHAGPAGLAHSHR